MSLLQTVACSGPSGPSGPMNSSPIQETINAHPNQDPLTRNFTSESDSDSDSSSGSSSSSSSVPPLRNPDPPPVQSNIINHNQVKIDDDIEKEKSNCLKKIIDPYCGLKLPNCYHSLVCYISLIICCSVLAVIFFVGHIAFVSIPPQCVCPEIDGYKKVIKQSSDWDNKVVCDYKFKNNNSLAFTRVYNHWSDEAGRNDPDKDPDDNKYYIDKDPTIDGECRKRLGLLYMYVITVPMSVFIICTICLLYYWGVTYGMFFCKNDRQTNDAISSWGDNFTTDKQYDLISETPIEIFWPIIYANILFVVGIILGFILIILVILAVISLIVISPILIIILILIIVGLFVFWLVTACRCTIDSNDASV